MNPSTASQPASETVATIGRTLVILCEELSALRNGLNLAEIEESLKSTPGVRVETVADLCRRPKALADAAVEGADRAVLGVCAADRSGREVDYHARKAGLDPFGVATLNLGGLCARAHPRDLATSKAIVLLSAAVAKARAFTGSGPEHVKPRLGWSDQKVSRRALFTLPPITYQPVASVRADHCMSEAGCDLCATVCPRGALSVAGGKLTVEKSACDACGLCVTECPRGAVALPASSLREFEAELEALLTAPGLPPREPRAILYVCDRNVQALEELAKSGHAYPAGWLPLRVPCTGMISPGWILQSLVRGAAAVGIVTCGAECKFEQQQRTLDMADYCRGILELLGVPRDMLRVLSPASAASLAEGLDLPVEGGSGPAESAVRIAGGLREPSATALALAQLGEASNATAPVVLKHERSPLGEVRIEARGCTGCESCARACPTDALASEKADDGLAITFDPTLCTGCGLCARLCPEDVLQVEHITDLGALSNGRMELHSDSQVHCERCGVAFAPASMVRRVEQLLQDSRAASQAIRRCPSCRGFGISATLAGHAQFDQQKEE